MATDDRPVQADWVPVPLLPLPAGDFGQVQAPLIGLHVRSAAELDWLHAVLHNVQLVMPPTGAYVPVAQPALHGT